MNSTPNIDDFVRYKEEYSRYIQKAKISGDKLTGLCPFHDDKKNSFSADLKTGKWHCFSEDIGGNYLDFYAKINNTDTKVAYREICEQYGIELETESVDRNYTLKKYSDEKQLPVDWLKNFCRLSDGKDKKTDTSYLRIPYFDMNSKEVTYRKRYAAGDGKFKWKYNSKVILYGEWRIEKQIAKLKEAKDPRGVYLILVEGESDSQSLWYTGLPALGVPGASMFKPDYVPILAGIDALYLHQEPDHGGETFIKKTTEGLKRGGFEGDVYVFSCGKIDHCKDPSDVFIRFGAEEAKEKIEELLDGARKYDINQPQELRQIEIKGIPIDLRCPVGWKCEETGMYKISSKTHEETLVCGTPIIITKRVKSLNSDDEKVEIAFLRTEEKKNKIWVRRLLERDCIFTQKGITVLTKAGAMVTSENAKQVIQFLSALEVANDDLIEWGESTSVLGWHSHNRFVPGLEKGIILDFDQTMSSIASACREEGSFEEWISIMQNHRDNSKFRFILAASFATPLLKVLNQRSFFIYNWGDSKGGKTATLKAALSVWGDPNGLMINFNATQTALETQATFFTDIPLGIDERQTAGTSNYDQSKIETLVYMIAEGKGKARGARNGGLRKMGRWQTIALGTGEVALITETSQTGVSTRVIELFKGPFKTTLEAAQMHQDTSEHFGWAGPAFVRRLVEQSKSQLKEAFEKMSEYVRGIGNEKIGSHASNIALVAIADALANDWIFEPHNETSGMISRRSWDRSCEMAKEIIEMHMQDASTDVNENAVKFLTDWIFVNQENFKEHSIKRIGMMNDDESIAYIVASEMSKALKDAGFSERKTKEYLVSKGLISTHIETNGRKQYTVRKRMPPDQNGNSKVMRFVEFFLNKAMGLESEFVQTELDWVPEGFTPVDSYEEDNGLPF